jgi:hypothetical protein
MLEIRVNEVEGKGLWDLQKLSAALNKIINPIISRQATLERPPNYSKQFYILYYFVHPAIYFCLRLPGDIATISLG